MTDLTLRKREVPFGEKSFTGGEKRPIRRIIGKEARLRGRCRGTGRNSKFTRKV